MMKLKKLIVLAIIFLISVAAIVTMNRLQNRKPLAQSLLFFPDFSEAKCSEMLFVERTDTARLKRKGMDMAWYLVTPCISAVHAVSPVGGKTGQVILPGYPADTTEVRKALETLKAMKREELVSRNPLKQAGFEVDTAEGLFVECQDTASKSLGGVYIGKVGARWDTYYVRAKGSNDVYLSGGSIRFALFANPKRWADKSIMKFDQKLVSRLKISSSDSGTIELARNTPSPADTGKKDRWEIISPVKAPANGERVNLLVANLANLNTVEFEGNTSLSEEAMGFVRPPIKLCVTLKNGVTKTVIVGKDKVAMKWVRNPEKPLVTFTVYSYTLAAFNPGLAYLMDTTATGAQSPVEAAKSALEKDIKKAIEKKKQY